MLLYSCCLLDLKEIKEWRWLHARTHCLSAIHNPIYAIEYLWNNNNYVKMQLLVTIIDFLTQQDYKIYSLLSNHEYNTNIVVKEYKITFSSSRSVLPSSSDSPWLSYCSVIIGSAATSSVSKHCSSETSIQLVKIIF